LQGETWYENLRKSAVDESFSTVEASILQSSRVHRETTSSLFYACSLVAPKLDRVSKQYYSGSCLTFFFIGTILQVGIAMSYLSPVRLNNKGAEFLSQGKIQEARQVLTHALNLTKKLTVEYRKRGKVAIDRRRSPASFHWLNRLDIHAPADDSFVYRRPLTIVEFPNAADYQGLAADLTCVIVYNISISNHVHGLSTTDSGLLQRALHGYDIIQQLRNRPCGVSPNPLLDMALANNMIHLYSEQCDYVMAKRSVSQLVQLLKQERPKECDDTDVYGFFTAGMWRQPTCAASA
jgi:hypothetical protein